MPCVGFHCPGNPLLWRKIEDCEACQERCLSIETLRWLWKAEFIDGAGHYHKDAKSISVTETMGCLRQSYYNKTVNYAEEPKRFKARAWGTAIHKAREDANQDGHSEVRLCVPLSAKYTLNGTADRLDDNVVLDYKTMDNPRKTYDEDNSYQLSVYDEMAGGANRVLLVLQDGRRDEKVHEVHRTENALKTACKRAEMLVWSLTNGTARNLEAEGEEKTFKFTKMTYCERCPHVVLCGIDIQKGEEDD